MAMRMSGLMSGMDTESIVQQLVEARSTKVTTAKKAQTKLNWKQDAWKELNTKLKNLQSKFLSNMRFSTSYTKKVTKVSNPNAVSVITGENAVNGVQELQVNKLAKTAYLTGGEVTTGADGEAVTALTKISDLKQVDENGNATSNGFSGPGRINVTTGNTSVDINIDDNTTISDVLTQLKNAGLNASFDAKWGRFSISSKESGAANDFSITAVDAGGKDALSVMRLQVSLDQDEATLKEYQKYAGYFRAAADKDAFAAIPAVKDMIDKDVASRTEDYLNQYKSLNASVKSKNDEIAKLTEQLNEADSPLTEDDKKVINDKITELNNSITDLNGKIKDIKDNYIDITETPADTADGEPTYTATAKQELEKKVTDRYYEKAAMADSMLNADGTPKAGTGTGATKVNGRNAEITLNGATYTNNNNTFEINGLTFTALAETKDDEPITVTTEQDVDGIYDMVKNFLKEYNSIINEMDKLYNADSAKDYEPLSDEEKEAMSEKDIEKYEQKIKDSLLRRDENLNTVNSGLKNIMSSGVDVNGKTMYLYDFGIETLSYFIAADNEKNAYHIAGDADDGYTSGDSDKLRSMIANDPDTVIAFFTKLSQNLYSKMSDLSKSVDGYRSFGNFYDDKKMKSDYDDYTSKIAELEQKLNDYEDSWYKKFSAMETAMAKMQQNANAVTSLLGGS